MEELKRKIKEFWLDKKKRKSLVVVAIIVATLVAGVVTISVALPGNSASSDVMTAKENNTTISNTTQGASGNQQGDSAAFSTDNATTQTGNTTDDTGVSNASNSYNDNSKVIDNGGGSGEPGGGSWTGESTADGATSYTPGEVASVECIMTIDCSSISGNGALTVAGKPWLEPYAANPYILSPVNIRVSDANGDGRIGVDEAIKQACNEYGIQYEFKSSSYLRGMNYLYEFDAGENSGWMYKVNGRIPNRGCNSYFLNGGEDIIWYYVISY